MVSKNRSKHDTLIRITIFVMLLASYSYFLPRWQDNNQNSRLDMVVAVVDDGTFQIDRYVKNTVDYARVGEHYYSDKAPGTAFIGIPVYALLRKALDLPVMGRVMERISNNEALKATLRKDGTGLVEEKVRFAIAQVAVTFAAAALPGALLGVLMYSLLGRFTRDAWKRIVVVLGYGLLTPAFAYSNAFYGHQLTTACLFGAFYLLFMAEGRPGVGRLAGAGFLMGYSVLTEYPSALVVAVLGVYALYRLGRKDLASIVFLAVPGLLVGVGLMLYNQTVFGSPFDLGYGHSELWMEDHSQGFMSLTWPHPAAVWGITFSPFRGLFILSPLLLLAVPGFVLWWRSRQFRAEWWAAVASTAAIFYFNVSSVMWWGGWAVGPRYALPMLPFLSLGLIHVLIAWGEKTWLRWLAGALYLLSLVATWGLTLAEQSYPPDTIRNPLLDYALPNWLSGNIARNLGMFLKLNGALSLLPLLAVLLVLLAVLWVLARQKAPGPVDTFAAESPSPRRASY